MINKKRLVIFSIIGCVVIVAAVGMFRLFTGGKVGPGKVSAPDKAAAASAKTTAPVTVKSVTQWHDAVGTIEPRAQARIEPQLAAQVNAVRVTAGDSVKKGQVIVTLDDRQMRTKLLHARQSLKNAASQKEQARQAVNAAEAAFSEAKSAYERIRKFYEKEAATESELEQARSRFLQARAGLKRAKDGLEGAKAGIRMAEQMVVEAEITLGYTKIKAPTDGEILKRLVDPGDMAMPGKPLLLLRTARGLRLEAHVRESLVGKVRPGKTLKVQLITLGKTVDAKVEELIPYADPKTRTFLVKAALPPDISGIYPGMYAKLRIPSRQVRMILVPQRAVRQVGQLELVTVKTPEGWQSRYIKTGSRHDKQVEVLSGLSGDETVRVKERNSNDG
ncbi:MAG: efflux RND transporter periplasmic adaptor subunit [Thermodesulfobacteriota bacterium]